MVKKNFDFRVWGGCGAAAYIAAVACTALFALEVNEWNGAALGLFLTALPEYAFFYVLPGALISLLIGLACWRSPRATGAAVLAGGILQSVTQLLILADFGLFRSFGFHFNLFVWNLLTTPGGFASMGMRAGTLLPLFAAVGISLAVNLAAAWFLGIRKGGKIAGGIYRALLASWRKYAWALLLFVCGAVNLTVFAWNHYVKEPVPLLASERIPGYHGATMRDIFQSLGFEEPKRETMQLRRRNTVSIDYPKAPIVRDPDHRRYNVVWLVCESWRADMLNDEVMPLTSRFVREHGIVFRRHFSGGNGTRQGMFSMFYGLYGCYWHPFLYSRTGAAIIDWMLEDGYDFGCFTSAKFSYPEFDQTIFSRLPTEALHSDDSGVTYSRDERNLERLLEFITRERDRRPFMAFMFFESPHYPYEFPESAVRFKDHIGRVDYLSVGASQAERIKNRYRNSCVALDGFLGRVFAELEARGVLKDTILVLAGDHGEEFFEHGRLGHNSDFSNEQTMTPLVLHLPDRGPGVYRDMSSHHDVTAILAPYFGVKNPGRDFTLGKNLLDKSNPKRHYTVIAGWTDIFFTGEKYKMQLPVNGGDMVTSRLYDAQDRPLPDVREFFRECRDQLVEVQIDMNRFLK